MRAGEFEEGSRVLRAKIDMASPNLNLRDPTMYRIRKATHHRTGDRWCIYPMYDFAHGQSDSIERITHSICTLEYEDHRPLYDWFCETLGIYHPQQIEFARLNLSHTVMSKRRLLQLVEDGHVAGWDDPRMPTIAGLRRRGYTPEAIRDFSERVGVARRAALSDVALLEHCLREDLNRRAARVMAVLRPLRVVIENYPEGQVEELEAVNNPEDASMGTRRIPFSRVIYIERDDFREDPPKKYFRLSLGRGGAPALRLLHPVHGHEEGPAHGRGGGAALPPTTPPRAAGTLPTAAASAAPSTGCRRPTRSPPRCASTTTSSRGRCRAATATRATGRRTSIPPRSSGSRAARWSRHWPRPRRRAATSSSAPATSASIRTPLRARWSSTAR